MLRCVAGMLRSVASSMLRRVAGMLSCQLCAKLARTESEKVSGAGILRCVEGMLRCVLFARHKPLRSMRCVHGCRFQQVRLRNDSRIVETAGCLHCFKEHAGSVWLSDCCIAVMRGSYEDISVLNNNAYCMLCNGCMCKLGHLDQLSEQDYHEDFEFHYDVDWNRRELDLINRRLK